MLLCPTLIRWRRTAMAVSLPYLVSYKNLPTLFEKINSAKVPDCSLIPSCRTRLA